MTETQQRFLRAIAERVPSWQVVEVHLFPPIRQGGVETGVAVVAEDPRRVAAPVPTEAELPSIATDEAPLPDASASLETGEPVHLESSADARQADVVEIEESAPADEPTSSDAGESVASIEAEVSADLAEPQAAVESQAAAESEAAEHNGNGAAPPSRFIIHTARYRLTLKGIDRGKWEVDVVAEADAPLDAVDKVVRGVQRRAGEGAEPDRLTSDRFLEALELPLAQLER